MENREAASRFNKVIDGKDVYVEYSKVNDKRLNLTHTFVPHELRGRGVASELIKEILEYARENKITVVPMCKFVSGYFKTHPEYKDLLD